jgi:hypothetical protein
LKAGASGASGVVFCFQNAHKLAYVRLVCQKLSGGYITGPLEKRGQERKVEGGREEEGKEGRVGAGMGMTLMKFLI